MSATATETATGWRPSPSGLSVLFLDIDGVLLPFGGAAKPRSPQSSPGRFSPDAMAALERIMKLTGATIVLSSTWRCGGGDAEVLDEFHAWREGTSVLGAIDHFEYTTSLTEHTHRAWEIASWLLSPTAPPVRAWVALDDEPLLDDGTSAHLACFAALFANHVVQTESSVGLSAAGADAAIAILLADPQRKSGAGTSTTSR